MPNKLLNINTIIFVGVVLIGLILSPLNTYAQRGTSNTVQNNSTLGVNPYNTQNQDGEEDQVENSDSTKKKVRKPLESYLFNDSIRNMPNFSWHVDLYKNSINPAHIDTLLNLLQLDYPYQREGVGDAYLGQLGGASIPLNYIDRPEYRNFEFADAFNAYYYTPENAPHYNVKAPFTQFQYMTSGQKSKLEENFQIRHAQNISPSTGFNIDYKSRGAKGIYNWQRARDKNLSMGVSHTGKRYTVHAGYVYNAVNLRENGGLVDDYDITDTIHELPANIPMRLKDAENKLRNHSYYVVQSYGIPLSKLTEEDFSIADKSSIFFGHAFEYHGWNKQYSDTKSNSSDFYDNWYISPTETHDSIAERLISNRVFIQMQPWDRDGILGTLDAGFGMDNHHYYYFNPDDYLTGNLEGENKNSYYVYGGLDGKVKKYVDWSGDIRFHPFGYRAGDITVNGKISLSAYIKGEPLTLSGKVFFESKSPGYWNENYYSNHFVWSNSFNKENETRFEVSLNVPSIELELGGYQSLLVDKIYYNHESLPTQSKEAVSVTGLYAKKDFTLGGFHLNHRVLLQWSTSQDVVPVPLASAFLSYFYEFNVVKDVLRVQIGIDGRYNTKYYAFGYSPAIAQFYNQREAQIGNYPMLDAFLGAKWRRMRILVKMQHANEDLFGSRDYFTVLHYPQNKRAFKFGLSWSFYD